MLYNSRVASGWAALSLVLLTSISSLPVIASSAGNYVLLVNTNAHGSKILVTNRAGREVALTVKVLGKGPGSSWETSHQVIPSRESRALEMGQGGRAAGGKVLLSADGEVSVAAVNLGSCSAYLSLPTSSLGNIYRSLTWFPQRPSTNTTLSILSLEANNQVAVLFRIPHVPGSANAVSHGGQTFKDGDILVLTLDKYRSLQLEASADFSGTLITSDYKVIVFNGNQDVGIADPFARDDTSSQVPPVTSWGTMFYAVPSPHDTSGASIGVVTHEGDNVVYVSGIMSNPERYEMKEPGKVVRVEVPAGHYVYLQSEKPVMASYFTKGSSAPNSPSYPSALLLPPAEQFFNSYDFSTVVDSPSKDFDSYLLLVVQAADLPGLTLDGASLSNTAWTVFPGTDPPIVGRSFWVSDGTHQVSHVSPGVTFGAYVLGFSRGDCTYAFPAGMALHNIYQVGSTVAPSGTTFQSIQPTILPTGFPSQSTTFTSSQALDKTTATTTAASSQPSTPSTSTTFQSTAATPTTDSTPQSVSTTFKASSITPPSTFKTTLTSPASPATTFKGLVSTFRSTGTTPTSSAASLASAATTLSGSATTLSGSATTLSGSATTFKSTETSQLSTVTTLKSTEVASPSEATAFQSTQTTPASATSPKRTERTTFLTKTSQSKSTPPNTTAVMSSITPTTFRSISTSQSLSSTFMSPESQSTTFMSPESQSTTFKSTFKSTDAYTPSTSNYTVGTSPSDTYFPLPTTFMTFPSMPSKTPFQTASPRVSVPSSTSQTVSVTPVTTASSTKSGRTTPQPAAGQSSVGQRFFLTFADVSYSPEDILVLVTAVQPGPFRIRVFTRPGVTPAIDRFYDFIWLPTPGIVQSIQVKLPSGLRISRAGRWRRGVLLVSERDITVTVASKGSCAAYLALPTSSLGTVYYAVTWHTSYPGQSSQLTVTAMKEDTTVALTFHRLALDEWQFEGKTYRGGDRLITKLARYESLHIQHSNDLTGTYIVSDKPVSVVSGNSRVTVGRASASDTVASQLPPVAAWGQSFTMVPLPGDQVGGFVKFVSSTSQTVVQVSGGLDFTLSDPGEFAVQLVPPGIFLSITANKPILALFYAAGQDGPNVIGHPVSLLLPPEPQWTTSSWFSTLTDDPSGFYETYALVVAFEKDLPGLLLDDIPVSKGGWVYIPGPPPQKVGKAVPVLDGSHSMKHRTDAPFLVLLHGFSRGNCAYALPAAMNLQSINNEATTARLPSITVPSSVSMMSTAAQPVVPTTSYEGQDTNTGTDFFMTFEENPPDTKPVKLMITTGSKKPVTVRIFTPPGIYPYFDLAGLTTQYQTTVVDLPGDMRLSGSGVLKKGVRVIATEKIAVSVLNLGSCSTYLSFEAPSIGLEYFVMTHSPSGGGSRATVTITAVTRGTTTLRLRPPPSAGTIILGGFNINNISLLQYESFRLSAAIDLTGLHISATLPITVRASTSKETIFGKSPKSDIATTQLPPVRSYGTQFHIFLVDAEIKVLSDFNNVIVSITRFVKGGVNPTTSTLTIAKAGQFVSIGVSKDEFVTLLATGPLLAVAYLRTDWPASLLLPPVQQYLSSYYFTAAPDTPGSAYQSYLFISIAQGTLKGLRIDGVPVSPPDRIDAFQMSGFKIPVVAGSHKIEHLFAIPFIAYVIGTASTDCSYAYPAGLGLEEIFNRSTPDTALEITPSTRIQVGTPSTSGPKTPSTILSTSLGRPMTPSGTPASVSSSISGISPNVSPSTKVSPVSSLASSRVSTVSSNITPSSRVSTIGPSATVFTKGSPVSSGIASSTPFIGSTFSPSVTPSTKVSAGSPSVTPSTRVSSGVSPSMKVSSGSPSVTPSTKASAGSPGVSPSTLRASSTINPSVTPSTKISSSGAMLSTTAIVQTSSSSITGSSIFTPSTGTSRVATPSTSASSLMTPSTDVSAATPSTAVSGAASPAVGSTSMRPVIPTSSAMRPPLSSPRGTLSSSLGTIFTIKTTKTTPPVSLSTYSPPRVFVCPSDGNYPLPGECDWYLECKGSSKTMLRCPLDLLFSPRDLVCLPEEEADCLDTTPDSLGKEYILTFISGSSEDGDIGLLITTPKPYIVYVTISAEGVPAASRQLTVNQGEGATVKLPAELLLPNSVGYLKKAVVVKATAEVSVVAINRGSCAAVLGLPSSMLGREYYTINWWEEDSPRLGEAGISISSVSAETKVKVTLPSCSMSRAVVKWQGQEYSCGQSIDVSLDRQDSFVITADGDLSGTRVQANKPVAVFTGNSKTVVGSGGIADNVLIQVPPTDSWGVSHVASAVPRNSAGGFIRIVAREGNTRIVTSRGHYLSIEKPGEVLTIPVGPNENTVIYSLDNKQTMAVYFTAGGSSSPATVAPSALLLPPLMQWDSKYQFSTLPLTLFHHKYENYVLIVVDMQHWEGIRLDGRPLRQAQWTTLSQTFRALLGTQVPVSSGLHTLHHLNNAPFMAYVYGSVHNDCSYAFPAGSKLLNITAVLAERSGGKTQLSENAALKQNAWYAAAPPAYTPSQRYAGTPSVTTRKSKSEEYVTPSLATSHPPSQYITPSVAHNGHSAGAQYVTQLLRTPRPAAEQPHTPVYNRVAAKATPWPVTPQDLISPLSLKTEQQTVRQTLTTNPPELPELPVTPTLPPLAPKPVTPRPDTPQLVTPRPDTPQLVTPGVALPQAVTPHPEHALVTPPFLTPRPVVQTLVTPLIKPVIIPAHGASETVTPGPVTSPLASPLVSTLQSDTARPTTSLLVTPPLITPQPETPRPVTPQPVTQLPETPALSPVVTSLLTSTPQTTPTGCDTCNFLVVTPSENYPNIGGEYFKMPQPVSGRAAYAQTLGVLYLYFLSFQTEFWIFGREPGGRKGSVMSATIPYIREDREAEHPANVSTWISNVDGTCQWRIDPDVRVECTCAPASRQRSNRCRRASLTASDKRYSVGNFTVTSQIYLGRPVYRHDSSNMFLFHHRMSPTASVWSVGPVVGGGASVAFIASSALSLDQVHGIWAEQVNGIWIRDYQLQLTCYT